MTGSIRKVTIEFYTKNSEDTGEGEQIVDSSGTPYQLEVGPFNPASLYDIQEVIITSLSPGTTENQGIEEMLRCKVTCNNESGSGWVTMRIFDPIFFDAAT